LKPQARVYYGKFVVQLRTNASLTALNTLALKAQGEALVKVESEAELCAALAWAQARETPVIVLGEGSNVVLVGDLATLVIQQATRGIEIIHDYDEQVILRVAAGENWHALVEWCLGQGFYGLENLALIPGTVGAAPIQNIGAYGVELDTSIAAIHALRIDNSETLTLSAADCEFGYRDSIFKHRLRDQLVITAVELSLSRIPGLQLAYPALANVLPAAGGQALTPQDVFCAVVELRQSRLPDPAVLPNAGSFFKNPVLESARAAAIREQFPEVPAYPQDDGREKFPAAWFIDRCGWKGFRENGVGVHPDHALVLVNYGSNSGTQLLQLAARITDSVRDRFGIELEIEPRVYGDRHDPL
jgi:UDP-N-acetylmuramate dehydrogenase